MTRGAAYDLGANRLALSAVGGPARAPWRVRLLRVAPFAAALGLHAALLIFLVMNRSDTAGMDKADPDGVTVEVLEESALDERYPALVSEKPTPPPQPAAAAAPPEPEAPAADAAPAPSPTPPPPPKPAAKAQPSKPAVDDEVAALAAQLPAQQKPSLDLSVPESVLAPPKKHALTAAEFVAKQLGGSAKARMGEIDEFTRAVARELQHSKPVSNGIAGQVVISFVVNTSGTLDELQLTQSSGSTELDDLVLKSVRYLHVRIPPTGAETRDRTFEITYDYKR